MGTLFSDSVSFAVTRQLGQIEQYLCWRYWTLSFSPLVRRICLRPAEEPWHTALVEICPDSYGYTCQDGSDYDELSYRRAYDQGRTAIKHIEEPGTEYCRGESAW